MIKVYFNLRKKLFSIMEGNRVVDHLPDVMLSNVTFKVRESGRQRVLQTKQKNVHAFVIGEYTPEVTFVGGEQVMYNPYLYDSFVKQLSKSKVSRAEYALLEVDENGKPRITIKE